jgi:hypothetical protein
VHQFVAAKALPGRRGFRKISKTTPMQSSRAVAGTDALSRYLTRRANQQHFFIIAKSVEPAAGAQRRLFGVTSGETP